MMTAIADFDNKIHLVIGDLLARSDAATKTILTVYDSSMCRDTNKAVLSGQGFQASDLEACASFLNIELRRDVTKIYSNKTSLALRIILEIESFFPTICEDCSEEYSNPYDPLNPPILRCFLCLQGSHNCEQIKEHAENKNAAPPAAGNVWLCSNCHELNEPFKPKKKNPVSLVPK